jgi:hypothetical protein
MFCRSLRENNGLFVKFANLERIRFCVLSKWKTYVHIYIHTSLFSFNLERSEQGRVRLVGIRGVILKAARDTRRIYL